MAGEMASVNKVILMGTVTTVPDFRVLENGTMMVNLQLETVSAGKTEKHHVIFFGHLGGNRPAICLSGHAGLYRRQDPEPAI